ncbi:hypothetical protein GCU60_00610 [Blastococcus saxobsidens]|uniref:DUF2156 domain-containing protein n=1 Tax=Blastococcus saxobsidens TaxID=138336 RepID=A0A6L9VXA2_9ACTN|nr:hypothetical protein [Blastococcus saxobsidens]NEK84278.1 hypothetical protein [Blastococcus saxobsidens]
MGDPAEVRDVAEATVPVASEAQTAQHLASQGRRVVQHRGRFWYQVLPGYYRPVHLMARLSAREATRPALACWGFQARLDETDAHRADARMPVHLVTDLSSFDEERLPKGRRNTLRRARQRARMVQLTGPALLREQGYDVALSAHERTGYGRLPGSREEYIAGLGSFDRPGGIVLAGIVDGRLGGYLTGYAVDGTAYAAEGVVATWALQSNISAGLFYEFVHACRRTGTITEIVDGLHARENQGLSRSKELNGIPVVEVPSRLSLLPGVAGVLRRRDPHKYYRMSGRD